MDNTDKRQVLNLYALFGVSLLLSLVPSTAVALISLIFLIGVFAYAYRLRARASSESLTENHAAFIIRTIWIATLLSIITLSAGSIYMIPNIDYAAFGPCQENLTNSEGFLDIYAAAFPCINIFIEANLRLLTITALIVALPVVIYLIVRYVRGLSRAIKGYRISNPKSWI